MRPRRAAPLPLRAASIQRHAFTGAGRAGGWTVPAEPSPPLTICRGSGHRRHRHRPRRLLPTASQLSGPTAIGRSAATQNQYLHGPDEAFWRGEALAAHLRGGQPAVWSADRVADGPRRVIWPRRPSLPLSAAFVTFNPMFFRGAAINNDVVFCRRAASIYASGCWRRARPVVTLGCVAGGLGLA
jgi:hypothetical protein